jgi:hypothetical protein
MALNQTDKDCLEALHAYLVRREARVEITAEEKTHFDALKTGDEAERIAAAKWYAENVALPKIQAELSSIDARKTDLQAEETALQAYIA